MKESVLTDEQEENLSTSTVGGNVFLREDDG
jgi:hypothetical protein